MSMDRLSGSSRSSDRIPRSTDQPLESRHRPLERRNPAGEETPLLNSRESATPLSTAGEYVKAFVEFFRKTCCLGETTPDTLSRSASSAQLPAERDVHPGHNDNEPGGPNRHGKMVQRQQEGLLLPEEGTSRQPETLESRLETVKQGFERLQASYEAGDKKWKKFLTTTSGGKMLALVLLGIKPCAEFTNNNPTGSATRGTQEQGRGKRLRILLCL